MKSPTNPLPPVATGSDAAEQSRRKRRKERGRRDGIVLQDTWRVRGEQVGKRWLARAWDARKRCYRSKAFEDGEEEAALQWAKDEVAKMQLKLSSAGALALTAVGNAYADELDRRGRAERHVADVRGTIAEAVEAGVVDLKADDLKDRVRRWLSGAKGMRGKGEVELSPRSRNKRLVLLRGAVRFAVGESLLMFDPLAGLKAETDSAQAKMREVYNPTELAAMVAEKHRDGGDWLIAVLMVYFGLRLGEAYAARWSWFDWQGRVLNVKQEADFSPKRGQERSVPMMQEALEILQPMANLQGRVAHVDVMTDAKRSQRFVRYLDAVGVTANGRGAHCVRHSWVSYRLELGIPSLVVQRQAGHRTILTTEKYSHALPGGWLKPWPRDGSGEFYLRRDPPKPAEIIGPKVKRKR